MIANSRCIACNLSKKEEKIRKHSDEKKKKEFIQKVTGISSEIWGYRINTNVG